MNSRTEVAVVESTAYQKTAAELLSPVERRALHLLLADNPACGAPLAGLPGLLKISYAGCVIHYAISPSWQTVYLLDISKDGDDPPPHPPSKEGNELLQKVLVSLTGSAVIAIVRGGLRWIREYMGH